jgi:hypothetical protein
MKFYHLKLLSPMQIPPTPIKPRSGQPRAIPATPTQSPRPIRTTPKPHTQPKPMKPPPPKPPKKAPPTAPSARTLTHALIYNPTGDKWSCKCGYVLGRDGHKALYALCPIRARDKARRDKVSTTRRTTDLTKGSYHESMITATAGQLDLFTTKKKGQKHGKTDLPKRRSNG